MEILNILALDEDVEVRDMALKHRTIKVDHKPNYFNHALKRAILCS